MKVIAFNGSPRRTWNTATLLGKALEGAAAQGAEVKLVHLYDLDFKGCKSCFACKSRGGINYGRCASRDDLSPILAEAHDADALVFGSPVYFGGITGEMKSLLERLMFPYLVYDKTYSTLYPRPIRTAFIYTMNTTEEGMAERGYPAHFDTNANFLRRIFGACETLCSCDTLQFADYDQVVVERFDPAQKAARREAVFPQDCAAAFDLGGRLVAA